MIASGRGVVDRAGVAALHGMTWRQAQRRRPWAEPGHPAPITRGKPALWDYEQVATFSKGEQVPVLPESADPDDLLDRWEAAERAGVDPVAWERDHYRGRIPAPDAEALGVPYWYRRTVDSYRDSRGTPRSGGGRPPGRSEALPRAEVAERVRELLGEAERSGEVISVAEIARRVGVHYTTAHRHVSAARRAERG